MKAIQLQRKSNHWDHREHAVITFSIYRLSHIEFDFTPLYSQSFPRYY